MLAFLPRWMRPGLHAAPIGAAPQATLDVQASDETGLAAADPALVRARFLALALAKPGPFSPAQTAAFLARLRDGSEGAGFDALRLPRLPAVVPQLLQALRDDAIGMGAVADLAARDPLIAGGIVRVANSALYAGGEPLHSLSQAAVRLGRDVVRDVVLRVALRPIHPAAPGTPVHAAGERLWTHAQCCGIACSALGHGFDGMLAGLAGATGASAALGLLVRNGPELLHADAVHAAFPRAMWRIAARAAQAWALPAAVVTTLHTHADGDARGELGRGLAQAELLSMQYLVRRWDEESPAPALRTAAERAAWSALGHDPLHEG